MSLQKLKITTSLTMPQLPSGLLQHHLFTQHTQSSVMYPVIYSPPTIACIISKTCSHCSSWFSLHKC